MHTRARKRFGQHFLHDPGVLDKIATAISPQPADHVVEIGPGRGALTRALIESWAEITEPQRGSASMARRSTSSRSTVTWRLLLREEFGVEPAHHRARSRRARLRLRAARRSRAVGGCESSATCRTTSPLPCCFTCSAAPSHIHDMHVMLQQREVVVAHGRESRYR